MKLTTAEEMFGITHRVTCADNGHYKNETDRCQIDVVTITDSSSKNKKK